MLDEQDLLAIEYLVRLYKKLRLLRNGEGNFDIPNMDKLFNCWYTEMECLIELEITRRMKVNEARRNAND